MRCKMSDLEKLCRREEEWGTIARGTGQMENNIIMASFESWSVSSTFLAEEEEGGIDN